MRLPHLIGFLIYLSTWWDPIAPATLRLLKASFQKEDVHVNVIDPLRYDQLSEDRLNRDELSWKDVCTDLTYPALVRTLVCPLQYLLIAEYRNRNIKVYPNVASALELIVQSKGHMCSHSPIHSPLGIADPQNNTSKSGTDMDTSSCIAMHTHDRHLVMGCALGVTESRSQFHVFPDADKETLTEMEVKDIPTKPILPETDGEKKKCSLHSFTYLDQLIIQDRICCRVARCVTIYYDQPGSDPWPLIRHVVPPEWVGFDCKGNNSQPGQPRHYKIQSRKRLGTNEYEVKADPPDENYELMEMIALCGLVFLLAVIAVLLGFWLWLRTTTNQ